MEEFISNLITADSSSFIGGSTLAASGPSATPSIVRGPMVLSIGSGPVGTSSGRHDTGFIYPSQPLMARKSNNVGHTLPTGSAPVASILRTDMSPMIAWLTSQHRCVTDSQSFSANFNTQANETYTTEDFTKKIPKPYIELTERDCAGMVAQAIRTVVLHTCNDEFRQQCLSKLGASNSRDVEREVKARLNAIITQQQEQQNQNQSDTENFEMDHEQSVELDPQQHSRNYESMR